MKRNGFLSFLASPGGRAVMTVVFAVIIFGVIMICINAEIVAAI